MFKLYNTIRPYAWGSEAAITEYLGVGGSVRPQAEMWLGAHPGCPSTHDGVALDSLISKHPEQLLGANTVSTFGPELPFLMKVLAARTPLSLQVHPTSSQAQAGYEREEAAGIPVDSPTRNYKDRHHKPEIIVAVTPFSALSGFRHPSAVAADVHALLGENLDGIADRFTTALTHTDEAVALHNALALLLSGDSEVPAFVDTLVAAARTVQDKSAETANSRSYMQQLDTITRTAAVYPSDPGVAATLLLNRVDLDPGDALYLDAGNIHAYLSGLGIEVMAASDNVLRGGLTPKHIDVAELESVVKWVPVDPPYVTPKVSVSDGGATVLEYTPGAAEFAVDKVTMRAGESVEYPAGGPRVVLVESGAVTLGDLHLDRGGSAFIGADEDAVIAATGESAVWVSRLPN